MKVWIATLALVLGACATNAPAHPPASLRTAAPAWLAEHNVPSVAIAFIEDGRVAWTAAYGEQSAGVPATPDTLYNVASLAKPVSAETMLRASSAGLASLDEPMSAHWVDPDLANDPRRDALTLRIALSHRTGFPNWRGDGALRFQSEPGQGFTYSGEGYEYARRYTQNSAGEPFEQLAQRLVLDPAGMRSTSYSRRAWFTDRIAAPHGEDGAAAAPDIRDSASMLASDDLYTSVGDYARFVVSVMNSEGVAPDIAAQRYTYPVELRDGGCGEGRLPMDVCPLGVGMGLGWMVFRYEGETVISHSGSDSGEQTIAFFVPERRLGVVIFTNSANGKRIFPQIVELLYPNAAWLALLRMQAG